MAWSPREVSEILTSPEQILIDSGIEYSIIFKYKDLDKNREVFLVKVFGDPIFTDIQIESWNVYELSVDDARRLVSDNFRNQSLVVPSYYSADMLMSVRTLEDIIATIV